jgi:putative endonuclease
MANDFGTVLYIGVTSNLERRVWEHKNNLNPDCFTTKYKCYRLVYYEHTSSILAAIEREKQLKNWTRKWKKELIESLNPTWKDLSLEWDVVDY